MVSKEDVVLELKSMLSTADLDTVTEKDLRKQLANALGESMDKHKMLIKVLQEI